MALVVVALAAVLPHEALGAPLVRMRTLDRPQLETGVLLSLVCGVFLTVVSFAIAQWVIPPLFSHRIAELARLASPAFVLSGLAVVPIAVLSRSLDFRALALVEFVSACTGAVVCVLLAVAGVNAEALVIGALAGQVSAAALANVAAPLVRPRRHGRGSREVLGFGSLTGLTTLVHTAYQNIDYAIVAARLSAADAGLYWRAFQLGVDYQSKIGSIMLRIAFPIYSQSESLDQMRRIRRRIVRTYATFLLPALAILIAVAPDLIPLLFGEPWKGAVAPTQILAFAGMTYVVSTGTGPLLMAAGKPGWLLALNLGVLISFSVTVGIAAGYGLLATCVAVLVYSVVTLGAQFLLEGIVGVRLRDIATSLTPPLAATAVTLAVAYPAAVGASAFAGPVAGILAGSIVGIAADVLALRILFPDAASDVALVLANVLRPAREAAQP